MSEERVVELLRELAQNTADMVMFKAKNGVMMAPLTIIEGLTEEEWLALHDRFCPLMPKCIEEGLLHDREVRLRIIVRALKWAAAKVREGHVAGDGRG